MQLLSLRNGARLGAWLVPALFISAAGAGDAAISEIAESAPSTEHHVSTPAQTEPSADRQRQRAILDSHLHLLNELSERRRLNIFFRNEQSLIHGVPVRFVNSFKGNLTFVRRDVVAIGRVPIVLARAYDSSLRTNADFGAGWRLTLAETIVSRGNGNLIYTDDSGSEWILVAGRAGRYTVKATAPTDIAYAQQTNTGVRIAHQNGWVKTFESGRLTEIADAYGNVLRLTYRVDGLARVDGRNGRFIGISRDDVGRVKEVVDDQGRAAAYHYNDAGYLARAVDIGGNEWGYEYDDAGRLKRAIDPRGNELLVSAYNARGQVRVLWILGAQYSYEYANGITRVRDHADRITLIEHNPSGIPIAIENAEAVRSEVKLDSQNRVRTLSQNGQVVARFNYDSAGRPIQRRPAGNVSLSSEVNGETSGDSNLSEPTNPHGGPLRAFHGGSTYEYFPTGDLKSLRRDDAVTTYVYNDNGQVEQIATMEGNARLDYYPNGRLHSMQFADGVTHEYEYSSLGFRKLVTRSDGSRKKLEYDVAGNLVRTDGPTPDGMEADQKVELDAYHRPKQIDYANGKRLTITYDPQGNPETIHQSFPAAEASASDATSAQSTFRYLYDALNRIVAVEVNGVIEGSHEYEDGEPDLRSQHDHKTMRVASATVRQSASIGDLTSVVYTRPIGSFFDVVRYDETLMMLRLPSAEVATRSAITQNSLVRRQLSQSLIARDGVQQLVAFDMASNIIFMPPEYDTINCYPPNCVFTGIKLTGNGAQGSATITAGSTVTLVASKQVNSECNSGVVWSLSDNAGHSGMGLGGSLTRTWTYSTPGTFGANASGECNGCDVFGSASLTVNVTPPPPPPCGHNSVLQTQTVATVPATTTRTKLGAGEQTTLTLSPAPSCTVTWNVSGPGGLSSSSGNSVTFTAHDRASTPTITATMGLGSLTRSITYNVVEPTHETAVKHHDLTGYAPTQIAVGMYIDPVTLHPTDVSWYRVEIMEVSGPATNKQGYFNQAFWNIQHPANIWVPAIPGFDTVEFPFPSNAPTPFGPGSFDVIIPMKWRVSGGTTTPDAPLPDQPMLFDLSNVSGTSGRFEAKKFCTPGPCAIAVRTSI